MQTRPPHCHHTAFSPLKKNNKFQKMTQKFAHSKKMLYLCAFFGISRRRRMKNVEIERKFLVVGESYKAKAVKHYEIVQGYLCKGEGKTVRVRIRDNQAFLTIKGGLVESQKSKVESEGGEGEKPSFARFEWEREIDVADAKQLLQLALPGWIEKTRWIVPAESLKSKVESQKQRELVWEIDEFHGRLAGKTLAEIELDYEEQAFEIPDFIGEEVTGRAEYYNANM